MTGSGPEGSPPTAVIGLPDSTEAGEPDFAPQPWYKNRVLLGLWATAIVLLLGLIVYGIVEIARGGGSSPSTTTSSTTSSGSSTSTSTTAPSTTTEAPPPSETPQQTPQEAPPQGDNSPAPAEPPHHHHHMHVPSTITLPHTVITLPHGY